MVDASGRIRPTGLLAAVLLADLTGLAGLGPAGRGTPGLAETLPVTRLKPPSLSCAAAQASVQAHLRQRGFYSPYRADAGTGAERWVRPAMRLDAGSIRRTYYGAPAGRPQELKIALAGDGERLYQELLSSPAELSVLGARIMEACPGIGLVSFNHWHEGGVPVGYFPDGTARTFQWVEHGDSAHSRQVRGDDGTPRLQYAWGYYFSP